MTSVVLNSHQSLPFCHLVSIYHMCQQRSIFEAFGTLYVHRDLLQLIIVCIRNYSLTQMNLFHFLVLTEVIKYYFLCFVISFPYFNIYYILPEMVPQVVDLQQTAIFLLCFVSFSFALLFVLHLFLVSFPCCFLYSFVFFFCLSWYCTFRH